MSEKSVWRSFQELDSALSMVISPELRQKLYMLLAAILHLGNIYFEDNDLEYSKINGTDGSQRSLEHAANLLTVDTSFLESLLLEKIRSGGDTTT